MNNRHQFVQTSAAAAVLGSLALPAFAQAQTQTLPLEQVKIINGFPVGGSADTTSRRVGEKLGSSAFTKNPVVVENKTGAAARIGIEAVKAAAPDGATLLLTPYSMMAIYPHISKQLSYDPFIDLMPVCMASSLVNSLAAPPNFRPAGAKTPASIIASANPAINAALKERSVIDSLAIQGMLPVGGTAVQMEADQKVQFDCWGPIVKRIGFTAEA